MSKKNYNHLYAAKGIGILLVIVGHVISQVSYLGKTIYCFHMPLFFLLSGVFAYTCEKSTFLPFFKKNLKQTIVPYVVFLATGILANYIVPEWRVELTPERFTDTLLHCNPYYWQTTGALWFLVALFGTRLLFYFYHKLVLRHAGKVANAFLVLFAFYAAFYVYTLEVSYSIPMPFQFKSILMALPFYMTGYLLSDEIKAFNFKGKSAANLVAVVAAAVLLFGYAAKYNGSVNLGGNWYNNSFLYMVFAFCGILTTLGLATVLQRSRLLCFLGKESMTIYIVHLFVQHFYNYIAQNGFGVKLDDTIVNITNWPNTVRLIVTVVLSVLIAYIVAKFRDRQASKSQAVQAV